MRSTAGLGALVREWRKDAAVRLLAILFIATLVLSMGPYVPGFRQLIKLPGFSFFRAPSRWLLAMSFALALLAVFVIFPAIEQILAA